VEHTGLWIAHEVVTIRKGKGQVLRPVIDDS